MSRKTASRGFSNQIFPCIFNLHGVDAFLSLAGTIASIDASDFGVECVEQPRKRCRDEGLVRPRVEIERVGGEDRRRPADAVDDMRPSWPAVTDQRQANRRAESPQRLRLTSMTAAASSRY